jgi:hypothetical protein
MAGTSEGAKKGWAGRGGGKGKTLKLKDGRSPAQKVRAGQHKNHVNAFMARYVGKK